jgi:hypothetical protein
MNKEMLNEQRPGSDLHCLIERVAYLVWTDTGRALPQEANWETAKRLY